ncbi:MAG: SelB C-terminal domain-containing protein, partial [Chloroflexi bacterium]|nr:SelB C-terminal domain-containing protein [Chloroflexota bacterium]
DLAILAPKVAIRWKVHDPEESKRLWQRAERNGRTVQQEKVALASTCLGWAVDELDRLQRFKLGNATGIAVERRDKWSLDDNGDLFVRRTVAHLDSKTVVLGRGTWAKDEEGRVEKVSETVVFSATAYQQMVDRISTHIRDEGEITVADVRDMFGTSRKYALALMDHMDHQRITRRVGDARVLR